MLVHAVTFLWTAGILVVLLTGTSLYLRRQVLVLQRRLVKLEAVSENQDARLFMLEQELRWLAARNDRQGEAVAE